MTKIMLFMCIGVVLLMGLDLATNKNKVEYEFKYSSSETIGNTSVATTVVKCAIFDPAVITLDEVKEQFIKEYSVDDELFVKARCDKAPLTVSMDRAFRPVIQTTSK